MEGWSSRWEEAREERHCSRFARATAFWLGATESSKSRHTESTDREATFAIMRVLEQGTYSMPRRGR